MSVAEQIVQWVQANSLALYGAVVGTFALGVSFIRVRHLVKRDAIRLKVSARQHPNYEQNLEYLRTGGPDRTCSGPVPLAAYIVSVTNISSITAQLRDVGVSSRKGEKYAWSCRDSEIPPKSSREYQVCISEDERIFIPDRCYAIDGVGREWKSRMKP